MKRTSILFSLAIAAFIYPSCKKVTGEGPVITENRTTGTYDRISLSIPAEAVYTQSATYGLELQAQQNILNEIETVILRNELKIRLRHPDTRIRSHEPIRVYISAPLINSIEVSGSGNFRVDQPFTPVNLRMLVSGSGHIRIHDVVTGNIDTWVSGSGDIMVDGGTGNRSEVNVSGSGFADMNNVIVKDADAKISGSGTIKVHATETLKASISGSGTVFYRGSPSISSHISGSGKVVKM
jgi:hypothetical protein